MGSQQYSSGSGNWTVPENVTSINFYLIGGGAGAGASHGDYGTGGGGGGGGAAVGSSVSVTPGASISYSVGAGGANQASGGNTAFGSNTAYGGSDGTDSYNMTPAGTGGSGGGYSGPDVTGYYGGGGANGNSLSGDSADGAGGGGGADNTGSGGNGSGTSGGSGGGGAGGPGGGHGSNGSAYGGGGGSQPVMGNSPYMTAGAGQGGFISISWTDSVPNAPSSLSKTGSTSTSIDLSWTDNSSIESGFKIYSKVASGGSYGSPNTNSANDTTYTWTGLNPYSDYVFKVTAYNGAGESTEVESGTFTTDHLQAPSDLEADYVTTATIGITWTNNDDAAEGVYVAIRRTPGGEGSGSDPSGYDYNDPDTSSDSAEAHEFTGLSPDTEYDIKILSYFSSWESSYVEIFNVRTDSEGGWINLLPRLSGNFNIPNGNLN